MNTRRLAIRALAAGASVLVLNGCAPLLIGGTATGASLAADRRPVHTVVDDAFIKLRIEALIAAHKTLHRRTHVDVTSVNGLVLLTGEAQTPADRDRVLTLARRVPGVRRLVDQLRVAAPSSFGARLADSWVTLRVKAALIADGLDAHITIVTAHRVVYLMGLVSPRQGNRAARAASRIPHVRSVVELFQYRHDRR